ncbi:MAG: hypothetical protein LV481_13460 [Methylacidiphilales bacterium]|nr:hypothetical protein [Candidatus Methylacidiphilales bacterium]
MPIMPLNNPLHDDQIDAGAFKYFPAVKTLKAPEQLVRVPHVKAHSVIMHEINVLISLQLATDFDNGGFTMTRVFKCTR